MQTPAAKNGRGFACGKDFLLSCFLYLCVLCYTVWDNTMCFDILSVLYVVIIHRASRRKIFCRDGGLPQKNRKKFTRACDA